MSTASGIPAGGDLKTPAASKPEKNGLGLAIAFAAVALCWGWSLNLASGHSVPDVQAAAQSLVQFAPFFLGVAVCLICMGWAAKFYWDGWIQSRAAVRSVSAAASDQRKPWIVSNEVKAVATVFVSGTILSWGVGFMSGSIAPAFARGMFLVSGAALWIVLISAFFSMLRRKTHEGNWRKAAPVLIAPPLIVMTITAIVCDPSEAGQHGLLYAGLWVALAASILVVPASTLPGLLPMWLVQRGKFDLALRLNRFFFWAFGNNKSTEGWILVMAGRYEQARAYLKPLAFDKKGHPRLDTQEFYLYALALSIDGQEDAAEMLFEAAVNVPQSEGNIHFGLAECLLTQKKNPERARELVENVLSGYPARSRSTQQRADRAQMLAFHAWALASNGQREAAESRLQEALSSSAGIGKCNLAGLQLPVGHTWLALGQPEKAGAAFQEALSLFPAGDIASRARKMLAQLN